MGPTARGSETLRRRIIEDSEVRVPLATVLQFLEKARRIWSCGATSSVGRKN